MDSSKPQRGIVRAITPPKPLESPVKPTAMRANGGGGRMIPILLPSNVAKSGDPAPASSSAGLYGSEKVLVDVDAVKPQVVTAGLARAPIVAVEKSPQRQDGFNRSLLLTGSMSAMQQSTPTTASRPPPIITHHTPKYTVDAIVHASAVTKPKLSFLAQQSTQRNGEITPQPAGIERHNILLTQQYMPQLQQQQHDATYAHAPQSVASLSHGTTPASSTPVPSPPHTPPLRGYSAADSTSLHSSFDATSHRFHNNVHAAAQHSSGEGASDSRRGSPATVRSAKQTENSHNNSKFDAQHAAQPGAVHLYSGSSRGADAGAHEGGSSAFYSVVDTLQSRLIEQQTRNKELEMRNKELELRNKEQHTHSKELGMELRDRTASNGRIVELELQVADLLSALESEKIKSAELETTFTVEKRQWETTLAMERRQWEAAKAEWGQERTKLLAEAEAGYNALFSNITDKAQQVIKKLRDELQSALQAAETARKQALEDAQALVKAADAAREDSVARTVHGYERLISQLRLQIEQQNASAATQMDALQRDVMDRIRAVEAERRAFQTKLEAASQSAIEDATRECRRAQKDLALEKRRNADLVAKMEREIEKRCQGFASSMQTQVQKQNPAVHDGFVAPSVAPVVAAQVRALEAVSMVAPVTTTTTAPTDAPLLDAPVTAPPSAAPASPESAYDPEAVARTVKDLKDFVANVLKPGNGVASKPGSRGRPSAPVSPLSPYITPPATPTLRPLAAAVPLTAVKADATDPLLELDAMEGVLALMTDEERKTWESLRSI